MTWRALKHKAAPSAVAAVIAVGAVLGVTEISRRDDGSAPPSASQPAATQRAATQPTSQAGRGRHPAPSSSASPTQPAGPVLAEALNTPSAAARATSTSASPKPRASSSRTPTTPPPKPSPPPQPSPTPTVTVPAPTVAPSPSSACVLGINALGITVCIPDRCASSGRVTNCRSLKLTVSR